MIHGNFFFLLVFLKYISDAFGEKHATLGKEKGADPEDRDEYTADNIFWVPPEARWSYLQGLAKDPVIGKLVELRDALLPKPLSGELRVPAVYAKETAK